jgi:hypothetical protein
VITPSELQKFQLKQPAWLAILDFGFWIKFFWCKPYSLWAE